MKTEKSVSQHTEATFPFAFPNFCQLVFAKSFVIMWTELLEEQTLEIFHISDIIQKYQNTMFTRWHEGTKVGVTAKPQNSALSANNVTVTNF